MDSLQRPSFWYKSWMVGTSEEPATSARKRVARELLDAIKDHDYDSQTLEEILLVIDHECLCRELENSEDSKEIFQSTIGTPTIGDFAHQLSSCLVEYVDASSHVMRELQCRALLSVLALLHLRGVTAQDTDSHTRLQRQINSLFRNLVWLPGESTGITPEAFRKVQCSHLLSLVSAQPFVKAEPTSIALLKIASDVLQLGVIAVNIALGFGIGDPGTALINLDRNFTRLLESPDNHYHDLFSFQGLTRIVLALHFYSRIGAQAAESHQPDGDIHARTLDCSRVAAHVALRQILRILNSEDNECFEADVHPPSRFREQLLVFLDRGPAKLDRYNYFYGLLDCATQLCSITDPEVYPVGFGLRLRSIIARSKEASFRWKAIEVLLSNSDSVSRSQQIQMILAEVDQSSSRSSPELRRQLRTEIAVISECLRGDNNSLPSLQPAISTESMDPGEWIEIQAPTTEIAPGAQPLCVPFPRGNKIRFSAAGLSPACSHAYFLNENMVLIYSLSNQSGEPADHPVLRLDAPKVKYHAAALSETFVAILLEGPVKKCMQKSIQVVRYNGQEVGTDKFGTEASGHKWDANSLIAIHAADDRTWVAVGGRVKEDGVLSGSIKIYRIDENAKSATLTRHSVSFTRPRPNPLALDLLKTLAFSPDGRRLVCATNNNRVLVWRLSNNARPQGAPFIVEKNLKREMRSGEISSTTLFDSSLSNPYVLCSTLPSLERSINKGEWSFISPVGSAQVRAHDRLIHDLVRLGKSGAILTAAICPQVGVIALVEHRGSHKGRLIIMPVIAKEAGGLSALDPVVLNEGTLTIQEHERVKISPMAVRFHETGSGFCLVAVDIKGKLIRKHFRA